MEPHAEEAAGGEGGRASPGAGLEGPMWRLGLDGANGGGEGEEAARLPERPGEADCGYYLRTGACGFGERCRYNHPRDRGGTEFGGGAKNGAASDFPERLGQPVCEYYLKTGSCKFGSNCKYHHPKQDGSVQSVVLNNNGFPLRPGEKECSYYMKTGHCKFGPTCKFHHPEFGGVPVIPGIYPPLQSASVPSPHTYAPLANWQMGRSPVVPGSYIPGSYTPMMLSSGMVPLQGWSPYPASVNPVASAGAQQTVQAGPLYGIGHHGSSATIAYGGPYMPYSPSNGQSSNNQQEHGFPERPGQPECQYYMRTGDCKFGATCKYHHPRDWSAPKSNYMFSSLCLPLRPVSSLNMGAQPCAYFAQNGYCRYGVACKYDHPMGTLGYSSSALPLSDISIAPYPLGFPVATLAPSSSSPDLRPEYISTKDPSVNQVVSPVATPEPVGAILPKGVFPPDTIMRAQTSTAGGSSSSPGGGH
ncbi:zinc finger CCCH domain-containing protein 6-like isoform X1 [Phragmites australis]|uniref:zinc finger CCCH domain-containing protein 6-like isoform X1 n=1 Tax=Phragmites australis TaxID=29695 RepID=UPI002D76D68C|nr:zinc finger CCCH domain-containing protein 6-like isoform X1 [Phragmites australis]